MSLQSTKVVRFLDEIQKVCIAYNMSISHEDSHGSFEIELYDDDNISWLRDANDRTEEPTEVCERCEQKKHEITSYSVWKQICRECINELEM